MSRHPHPQWVERDLHPHQRWIVNLKWGQFKIYGVDTQCEKRVEDVQIFVSSVV